MPSTSRLRRAGQNLALAVAGVVFSLILGEVVLRLFLPIPYSEAIDYVPDGRLGCRLTPERVYLLRSGGRCTVNNLGFRGGVKIDPENAMRRARVIAVGGSATFSYNSDDERVWTRVLERSLQQRYGPNIEVINAGVPGYSSFESKVNYLYQLRPLKPDIVIAYETWNDMKWFRSIEAGIYPKKGVAQSDWRVDTLRRFQLAWRVRNFLDQVVAPRARENRIGEFATVEGAIARDGAAHRWERQNFSDLALLLKSDGVIPVFASQAGLLSSENLDDPEVRSVVYAEYVNLSFEDVLAQWEEVSRIIREEAEAGGALFIDVRERVPHTRSMFLDHVHLTEAGDSAVASAMFEGLLADPRVDALMRSRNQQRIDDIPSPVPQR